MNRPINNVVFKGAEFAQMGNCVEIIEDVDNLKIYIECMIFMDTEIDEEITRLKNMLSGTTDIGFSDGTKDNFIPYFKNLKHIYTDNLGFKVTHDKPLTYKVLSFFRNKK